MVLVPLAQIILFFIFRYCNSSNYSIFYHRYPSLQYYAAINVKSLQFGTLDRLHFDINYLPGQNAIVMLNNKRCKNNCDVFLSDGEQANLTFNGDSVNIISFYQFYSTITYIYYRECYQPMENVKCRFRQNSIFEICICNNHLSNCTYDEPLYFDESWCNNRPPTRVPISSTETPTSLPPTEKATTESSGSKLKDFTLMYSMPNGTEIELSVNISLALVTPDEVIVATFDVWHHSGSKLTLHVNNMTCSVFCVTSIIPGVGTINLDINVDSCESLIITADNDYKIHIVYDSCSQPMDNVKCRARTSCSPEMCLCNGLGEDWNSETPFLLQENNCSSSFTFTTSISYSSTTTTKTIATTRSSTLSPTPTKSTLHTSPLQSSSKIVTTTTAVINTTPADDTLKHLSESGVGPENVTRILNETLVFSETRSDLTSIQIQEITTILHNSAAINGLQPSDSRNILLNMDCILSAQPQEIQASGNSTQILLSLLPTLVLNTNASQFDFLSGENFGFTATNINCSSATQDSLLDFGNAFELLNGSIPGSSRHNSISIPVTQLCYSNSLQQATHLFMTLYRNRKLFIGTKQYQSYNSVSTMAQRSEMVNAEADFPQTTANRMQKEGTTTLPSPCSRQIALPEEAPVMSGTLLNNGVPISRLTTESTIAVLRFNITNVLSPLHGHFRVTWWDTEKLEWSTENQCETNTEGQMIVARCQHLTDFTLIVDAALNDPNVCETALIDLGYAVNALSVISLAFLLLMSLFAYWPSLGSNRILGLLIGYGMLSRDFVSLIHKLVLLLFYFVFTIFSDQKISGRGCEFFGALSYWLLLCSVILTIFQALRLTAVIGSIHSWIRLILAPSSSVTVSLLVPFAITVLLLVLTNFFDRGDCFCWVRPDYIIYAVIVPISILIINGIVCTILVCIRLFGMKRKLSKSVRYQDRQFSSKVIAVILMQISLGMPWILQYLTLYSPYTTVWHYVFTIVMGSQGTILALLFLYKRTRSMSSYRRSQHVTQMTSRKETMQNEFTAKASL